ncbi:hypothetical protein I305_01387 [Cryptococcus gattii E566]|uniref:RRM domain-containing protein n=2 Tax=Cryptococcus gattii TaxID=37769 RepID=E6R9C1_CRYGW|nr:Hypothetical Protein CGB_G2570C [Cryptococcus gattii WM276]ADV23397.1 Hypothetical Protein CGB_G2570C [Cryptococcus gattii WM276]KIR77506.1 hypothetical protein I306_05240 [Cryptococcus gattii EJB2]KIY35813.1 hypothetical protein I305_01387 [Cryptococcus gattii E566]KJE01485.1 hypothetical protein I311_04901 [Cryptococcus gattii NT-10]
MGRTSRLVSFNGPSHVRLYDVIGNGSVANHRVNLAALPDQYAIHNSVTSPKRRSISKSGLLPPASLSELRNRTKQAIIERCGTVSRHNSLLSSLQTTRGCLRITTDKISYYMQADDQVVHRAMERFGMHDSSYTVAAQLSEFYDEDVSRGTQDQTLLPSYPLLLGMPNVPRGRSVVQIHSGVVIDNSQHQNQRLEPRNPQSPSKTLWIGNLDVQVSKDMIYEVFGQYGPIEDIRVLPEKVL